ncbi:hypothetical protein ILYODFUR_011001 [Ilyodon furcidens]|uniref:Uncharacterized protein n=1 Tax=Ilyodon furcidens TaxID=33524 RepID=A0ABV0SMG1_9TELE
MCKAAVRSAVMMHLSPAETSISTTPVSETKRKRNNNGEKIVRRCYDPESIEQTLFDQILCVKCEGDVTYLYGALQTIILLAVRLISPCFYTFSLFERKIVLLTVRE